MTHQEWIRTNLRDLSRSLGFRFTPAGEIEDRLVRIRASMEGKGVEALLILEKMNLFYLSGTTQDGILYVPLRGAPLLMVRREIDRAGIESPLKGIAFFQSLRDLPLRIQDHCGAMPKTMGLELDVLPVRDYWRLQEVFKSIPLIDASSIVRDARKIKSPFEIDLMRTAGEIGKKVYRHGRGILREGMTEIELGGLLEAFAKTCGHEGLLRVRSLNYEAYTWHVLSGPNGGIVSQSDSPMGGLGLSPAFPVGASRRPIRAREPVLVDFGICYHGYQVDETRMFAIGKIGPKWIDAYQACREIHDAVLKETRPGADCEALFWKAVRLAENLGYRDSFLGPPGLQTRFIAHGIGLELNEPPFLARGQSVPLEKGMTFAIEPKIVFPGEGAVGIENTVAVTGEGYEILTPAEMGMIEIDPAVSEGEIQKL